MGAKLQCCSHVVDNQTFQKHCLSKASKEYSSYLIKVLEDKLFYMDDIIVGDWGQQSLKTGKGIIFSKENIYFQGDIVDSKASGFGRIFWPNRAMYIGRIINNQANGQGQLIFDQGVFSLKGAWKNGEPLKDTKMLMKTKEQTSQVTVLQMKSSKNNHQNSGKETIRIKIEFGEGVFYEGEVKQKKDCVFKFEGEGKLTFADGSRYVGSFLNGRMDGKGKYYWASNQHWYEGQYKNNLRDGKGVYYFNKAIYKKGIWRGGVLISEQK